MLCCATLYNDVVEVSERDAANFDPYPFGGCCYHRAGKYTYGFSVCSAWLLAAVGIKVQALPTPVTQGVRVTVATLASPPLWP